MKLIRVNFFRSEKEKRVILAYNNRKTYKSFIHIILLYIW